MAQVVQAKCPHCSNILRIPAEWVHQPMRCKHCHNIFQAVMKAPAPAPPAPSRTPLPNHKVKPAPGILVPPKASRKSGRSPFSFGRGNHIPVARPAPGGSSLWKGALLGICVVGLAALLVFFGRDFISRLTDTSAAITPDRSNPPKP